MSNNIELSFAKLQFGAKQRNRVYGKLVRLLSSGVPLPQALDIIWRHSSDDGKKPKEAKALIIDQWRRQIAEGRSFGQAIKGWVPDSDRLVIEGGEAAGNLTIAIEKAMAINESARRIKSTVIKGVSYPIALAMAAVALLVMIVQQVVPAFDAVLPRDQWQGLGAQMAFVADLINNYLFWAMGVVAVVAVVITVTMPRWTSGLRVKFDRYPPWSIYRLVLGSGFMLTVSGMIKAGIPLPKVLTLLSRDASPWYKQRLNTTSKWVAEGFNLGDALHKTGYEFPDKENVQDLRAYAGLNKFDEALERIGTEWLNESVEKIEVQTGVLRTVSLLALGLTFIWIYLGIFSLQQQITSTMN